MLVHKRQSEHKPQRVVVLGASGVLGIPLVSLLQQQGVETLALRTTDIDLSADGAADELSSVLRADDTVVFLACLTPDRGRDLKTYIKNIKMADAVVRAFQKAECGHLLYMSSDAVYPFSESLVTEITPAAPFDLYGSMHRTREIQLQSSIPAERLAIVRCTLVCSENDNHNSYGPNRFRKQAMDSGVITIGGGGLETRDHVFADDVALLMCKVIGRRSYGLINAVSGQSHTFKDVAALVAVSVGSHVEIRFSPNNAAVTHRHYSITNLIKAFPDFTFQPLERVIPIVQKRARGNRVT